ncbi:MAG: alpha/beta fold hydrolase [Pseudomonadota bacterium]
MMSAGLLGAATLLVALLAVLVYAAYLSGHWYFVDRVPDEIHFAATGDGWRIAIMRYRPSTPNGSDPVLLCHGLAANHLNLDLSDRVSLARFLARAGYDVWSIELRGRGLSTRPRPFSRYRYDWSFDEYVEQDFPAALAEVRRATGRQKLHLVGYSLGGMVAYAVLADPSWGTSVRSAVVIAAPATFRFQSRYLFSWPLRSFRWLRHRFLARLFAPLAGNKFLPSVRLLYERDNVPGSVIRRFMTNATASFSRNELLQMSDWIAQDSFRSIDHRRDYRSEMKAIAVPILFVAGNRDRLAPLPSVKDAYSLVGSGEKLLVVASRAEGMSANYGHLDLVLGNKAAEEIFPLVSSWLDRHSRTLEQD